MIFRRFGCLIVCQLSFLAIVPCYAQDSDDFARQAFSSQCSGDFRSASHLYATAVAKGTNDPFVFVDAAACFAASQNRDTAFYFLNQALGAGWGDLYWIEHDNELTALRDDPRWLPFLDSAKARIAILEKDFDKSVRSRLLEMRLPDQIARRLLHSWRSKPWALRGLYRTGFILAGIGIVMAMVGAFFLRKIRSRLLRIAGSMIAVLAVACSVILLAYAIPTWRATMAVDDIDLRNIEQMKHIVERATWPGKSLVGEDAAEVAWLLVQHADLDLDFQERCLPLLEEAARSGEATFVQAGNLRARIRQNKRTPAPDM
jgi:hypothetical protein